MFYQLDAPTLQNLLTQRNIKHKQQFFKVESLALLILGQCQNQYCMGYPFRFETIGSNDIVQKKILFFLRRNQL
jgi:hypothetical protein